MDTAFGLKAESWAPQEGDPAWRTAPPSPDNFMLEPEDSDYETRRARVIAGIAANPGRSLLDNIVAVRQGTVTRIPDDVVEAYAARLDGREDCADFRLVRVVRALYEHAADPVLTPQQFDRLKTSVLGFKYWVDEPGPDTMITWSENHQILFLSGEYLVGQMFPDETFTNNGRDGRWHKAHAEPLIRKWIERRARWGFSEWDSNVYMEENLAAVLAIADFAYDPHMARLVAMCYDLMLFDIGSDLFRGMYACTHGRTYAGQVTSGRNDSITGVVYQVWGYGRPDSSMCSTPLAMSRSYRPPRAIINAGRALPEELENRERHGINLRDMAKFGLDPKDIDDLMFLWGMGAFTQPETVVESLKAFHGFNLWNHPFLDASPPVAKRIPANYATGLLVRLIKLESDRTLLSEVNKLTYRTPDYQLSSAQDFRAGGMGNQQHAWQATLGPDAVVFTGNPGSPAAKGDRTPTYWAGSNRLPRVAQYKKVLFAIYNLKNYTVIGQRHFYEFTHAFFPRWAFDRVETEGNWNFGSAGDAYIALYSSVPAKWTEEGREAGVELVAAGRRNVWVCVLGRRAVDGPFDKFKASLLEAPLKVKGLKVDFDAPGIGRLKFGWDGPLTLDGAVVPISGFKRFDNPFCQADFNRGVITITAGGSRLTLDFPAAARTIED